MSNNITETVLRLMNKSGDEAFQIRIEAKLKEILAYLNREDVDDDMFYPVCTAIADCLAQEDILGANVQSYSEGDVSISFSGSSPFFGRLDAFKVIKGIRKNDVQK